MKPLHNTLAVTTRPRLLVVAARHALAGYQRDAILPRLLNKHPHSPIQPSAETLADLVAREAAMDHARRRHDASWRAADHVLIMAALIHEAALLRAPGCDAVTTAQG